MVNLAVQKVLYGYLRNLEQLWAKGSGGDGTGNMPAFANTARSLTMPGYISRVKPAAMQDSPLLELDNEN